MSRVLDSSQYLFHVVGAYLLVGALLKTWAWRVSVRWALKFGHDYVQAVQAAPFVMSRETRMRLIRSWDSGGTWPGAKSVRVWTATPNIHRLALDWLYARSPLDIPSSDPHCVFAFGRKFITLHDEQGRSAEEREEARMMCSPIAHARTTKSAR